MKRMFVYIWSLLLISGLGLQAQAAPQNPPATNPAKPASPPAASPSQPAGAAPAAGFKLGFIDLERALLQVEEGKKEFGDLEKFINDKQTEAKTRQDAIENLRKQLSTQEKSLKEDVKTQMQRDIESKMTELERFTQDTQREIESRRNAAINKIGNKMQPLINALAKEQGYAAILVFSPSSQGLYAYIDLDKYDVTNAVIARYNKSGPAAAAPSAPAPNQPKTAKK